MQSELSVFLIYPNNIIMIQFKQTIVFKENETTVNKWIKPYVLKQLPLKDLPKKVIFYLSAI